MRISDWSSDVCSSDLGVSRLIGSLAIFITLRTFSSGMERRSASSSGVGSRPISWRIWREVRTSLFDRLDHVDRDADGAGLVGDRAGDRLENPPGGVGRELVAAAVFELIDRLHEDDITFMNKIKESTEEGRVGKEGGRT